jgi:prepilin-type N-terminal cleavage/methylation domain-containing protein
MKYYLSSRGRALRARKKEDRYTFPTINTIQTRQITGFTLVELLISISILGIMAAMSISSYPKFSEQISLTSETYKMLAYFRESQSFGVSAVSTPGVKFIYAFKIDKSLGEVSRVLKENPSTTDKSNSYYILNSTGDTTSEKLNIKKMFNIQSIEGVKGFSTTTLDIGYSFFRRPNPEARLMGTYGGSASIAPSTSPTESFDRLVVTISSVRNPGLSKKIVILSTGQMYISDW